MTYECQHLQGPPVDHSPPIRHETHHDFLPSIRTPRPTPVHSTQVCNILHDRIHRPAEELFIFIVHCYDNEELGLTAAEVWTKVVLGTDKFIWVGGAGRVTNVCEFFVRPAAHLDT